ncbi:hypothetical protein VKT23_015805 [Stygiomarasmius scandens]|uniref:F-box domain-containing protein n=1 Tax=Marasmiellus scandens TaxID=2682957 RepID=A0ABR1IY36_9AGAR
MNEITDYLSGKRIQGSVMLSPEASSSLYDTLKCEEKRVTELVLQLEERKRVIAILQNLLSPIRRLPPEILSEIFLQYVNGRKEGPCFRCWSKDKKKNDHFYYDILPILLLAQICSYWRQTIFAMPSLWCLIQLNIRRRRPRIQLLNEWLGHSVSLPLDIKVVVETSSAPYRDVEFLLNSLIRVCSRWRTLELDMSFDPGMKNLLRKNPLTLPLLEKLSLSTSIIFNHDRLLAFANAPQLASFSFSAIAPPFRDVKFLDMAFPSSQITELKLSNVSNSDASHLYSLVRNCTLLRSLDIRLFDIQENSVSSYIQNHGVIHLTHLRVLHVKFRGLRGSPEILDAFRLPALKELVLEHPYDLDDLQDDEDEDDFDVLGPFSTLFDRKCPKSALVNLQKRSGFELKSFELDGITSIASHGLLDFLRVVPTLESLTLEGCYLDVADLCESLTVGKKTKEIRDWGKEGEERKEDQIQEQETRYQQRRPDTPKFDQDPSGPKQRMG